AVVCIVVLFDSTVPTPDLHPFPTRRSSDLIAELQAGDGPPPGYERRPGAGRKPTAAADPGIRRALERLVEPGSRGDPQSPLRWRSEEHTSELQSRENLVCRLLLEKKKTALT